MELSSLANGWVESYLEALLTTGLSRENAAKVQDQKRAGEIANAETQICAKYYVQQILALDQDGIRQAWTKANRSGANRTTSDKDARLEYLSWRVWGMKHKREAVRAERVREAHDEDESLDNVSESTPEPLDDLDGLKLAIQDSDIMPVEDNHRQRLRLQVSSLSESSLDDTTASPDYPMHDNLLLELDDLDIRPDQRYYIVMISMHGLVRGERMELGKDPDTGGQVKYVVELAKAMAQQPGVYRVDLLTRLIQDPTVDSSYGQPEECLVPGEGELGGAYIVRLPCGNPKKYLRKEALWPHIREFADQGILHAKATLAKLRQTAGENCQLLAVHGHYADAGEAAALMSHTLGADMLLTGHSLGRNKLDHLLKSGTLSRAEIEANYAISRRIEGEERAVDGAILVFTSTQQEINDQWGLYHGYNPSLEEATRLRPRRGRRFPHMVVIPPGLDFSNLKVDLPLDPLTRLDPYGRPPTSNSASVHSSPKKKGSHMNLKDLHSPTGHGSSTRGSAFSPTGSPRSLSQSLTVAHPLYMEDPPIWRQIFRFLRNPRKPVILAMSRPDAKKNITTLVKAFGECRPLREIANLVLVMGNRDVIDSMASGSQKVLNQVLNLIDAYDLYGSVAYPKHHSQQDISDIYLLPAATRGVFVNVALQEPFGLTLIEAAAHAVPIVATMHGGPVDIITTLKNGVLVDPSDSTAVAEALLKIVTDSEVWDDYSSNGRNNIMAYSWPSHCAKYLRQLETEHQRATKALNLYQSYSASFDSAAMSAAIADIVEQYSPASAAPNGTTPPAAGAHSAFASLAANAAAATTMGLDIHHDRHSSLPLLASAGGGYTPPLLSPLVSATTDDLSVPTSLVPEAPTAALRRRARYTVLAIDSAEAAAALAARLRAAPEALRVSGDVGLGVTSVLSHRATLAALEAAGLSTSELDFIVSGAGSEIWYPSGDKLVEDSGFEFHIDHIWDRLALKRTIARMLGSTPLLATDAATKLALARANSTALVAGLSKSASLQLPSAGNFKLRRDVGHYHLEVELPHPSAQAIAKLPSLIRQRLRATGMRAQLTVQADPAGGAKRVLLHLTPLRASRALALRWLAHVNELPMDVFTVVTTGKVAVDQLSVQLGTSDGEEVLGGMQEVVVADMPELQGATLYKRPLDVYDGRVTVLKA